MTMPSDDERRLKVSDKLRLLATSDQSGLDVLNRMAGTRGLSLGDVLTALTGRSGLRPDDAMDVMGL